MDGVSSPYARDRIRLHAGVLVFFIPAALLVVVSGVASGIIAGPEEAEGWRDPALWLPLAGIAGLSVSYLLNRKGRYRWAAGATVGTTMAVFWVLWAVEPVAPPRGYLIMMTATPVLLASILLDIRWTLGLAVATHATVLVLVIVGNPLGVPSDQPGAELIATSTLFLIMGVAVVGAALLGRNERRLSATNQKLQQAHEDQLMMLNNVAHDLASPLTPIRIQLYLLETTRDEARVAESVRIVNRNVAQLDRLVQDLKDMAKAEAGQLRVHPETVDLVAIVQHAVEAHQAQAAARGVTLTLVADSALGALADPQRITQVLYNLVGNAIKFTPADGRVTVGIRPLEGMARVEVTDTGRGLTTEECARLFRPFVQVHDPKEVQEKGTGLGLFISKQIVEAHGGRIWIQSDGRGRGSTFAFTMPLADGRTGMHPEPSSGAARSL